MADHKQEAKLTGSQNGDVQLELRYQAGLPPPVVLQDYDRILPGAAERYFVLFEKQVAHRHETEKVETANMVKLSKRGMMLGFVVNLVTIGAAVLLGYLKVEGAAIASIVAAVLTNLVFFSSFLSKKK